MGVSGGVIGHHVESENDPPSAGRWECLQRDATQAESLGAPDVARLVQRARAIERDARLLAAALGQVEYEKRTGQAF